MVEKKSVGNVFFFLLKEMVENRREFFIFMNLTFSVNFNATLTEIRKTKI